MKAVLNYVTEQILYFQCMLGISFMCTCTTAFILYSYKSMAYVILLLKVHSSFFHTYLGWETPQKGSCFYQCEAYLLNSRCADTFDFPKGMKLHNILCGSRRLYLCSHLEILFKVLKGKEVQESWRFFKNEVLKGTVSYHPYVPNDR